ncbi:pyridoxamine 5'-phosphate oxidase family protein [Halosimplex halophilum]|uniref:pyridoxamine 5'-phosphate oxidase family protein n=1 Tax=Halosimplex halophilum TaxID=2559572 RepID=UPI00107FD315|nr:pyridoxamine 5'-phosphate oxidase family protein [Halosimplex halophilum]
MTDAEEIEMGAEEVDRFLGSGGTGVLSLSTVGDEPPDAVPVSYGYDAEDRVFYFRISVGHDDDPGELAGRPVTFVAYGDEDGDDDGRWRSVVARGRLHDTEEAGIETETLAEMERIDIPLVDVFEEPLRMVSFDFFRLDPDEFTGRRESLVND